MPRRILGVVLGLVAAGLVVMIVETLGMSLFPLPESFDPSNPDLSLVPTAGIAMVGLAWVLGPLVGGFVATLVARPPRPMPALVVGTFFLAADIANLVAITSPTWMWVLGIAAPLPCAWVGFALAKSWLDRRRVEDRSSPS